MFKNLSDRTSSILYVVLVASVAASTASFAGGLVLAISPLLVTALMMFVVTRDGYRAEGWRRLGITRLGLRWWPVALAATAGVSVTAAGMTVVLGFSQIAAPTAAALQDLLSLCITGTVLAFAEEVGWRGYLQPRVVPWLGEKFAYLGIGVVWVIWHLMYILFTPFYHADGDRWIVLTLFSATVIAFSFLFGQLRTLSGSVWPVVLAHVAHNVAFAWIGSAIVLTNQTVLVNEYLAGDTGLFVLLGTIATVMAIAAPTRGARPVARNDEGKGARKAASLHRSHRG
ncbi:hypothetical protein C3B61_15205 [Cryobacterium zongtaii]|uniref:CAAX prenyl protease 2/Lysostaphin resistance protein A-like domain-containing protein n=1 Tax=Cryobacterium zongtaii TaxID=1259217 RepID=A0A2S3ZBQ5_9MICO|nr:MULTISPECIES: type II CAAX endopeptidase family protein [Cryobacterium]POH63018.1 hypothetical protein C3B61_15205 [Cryobacterium zongtaii]